MDGDKSHNHREILCDFFIEVLGLEQRTAEEGASKMEDVVSMEIIERMAQYAWNLKGEVPERQSNRANRS